MVRRIEVTKYFFFHSKDNISNNDMTRHDKF